MAEAQVDTGPKGVISYITSENGLEHVEWMEKVFEGKRDEIFYTDDTKTKIMHCSLKINDGVVYLSDDIPMPGSKEESTEGKGSGNVSCHLNMPSEQELDDLWKRALDNKATSKMDLAVQFWGDKFGMFVDPFGVKWTASFPIKEGGPPDSKKAKDE